MAVATKGTDIVIDRRKWPATVHYRYPATSLGQDGYGWWLGLRAGSEVRRGDDVLFRGEHDGLILIPSDDWWMAWFPAGGDFDLFVDVVTPARLDGDVVNLVDLDLDVVRLRGGGVDLVDEDDFEANRVALRYPDHIVSRARRVAQDLVDAVTADEEPFGRASAPWWAELTALLGRPIR